MPDHMGSRGMGSLLGNDGAQYQRLREIPWVSATLGLSYGSSSWYSVMSDFHVMRKGAVLAVSSSLLASLAIREEVDAQDLGGWKLHAEVTGFADLVVDSDEEALDAIKRFLDYLPATTTPHRRCARCPPAPATACATSSTCCHRVAPRSTTCAR
jgi:methylmalonyl-CoA decarboxylase subunit alpha